MSTVNIAPVSVELSLLKIITKRGYRNQKVKAALIDMGCLTKAGNVTKEGKNAIFEYYKGFSDE